MLDYYNDVSQLKGNIGKQNYLIFYSDYLHHITSSPSVRAADPLKHGEVEELPLLTVGVVPVVHLALVVLGLQHPPHPGGQGAQPGQRPLQPGAALGPAVAEVRRDGGGGGRGAGGGGAGGGELLAVVTGGDEVHPADSLTHRSVGPGCLATTADSPGHNARLGESSW